MWILGGGGMKQIVKRVMDRDPMFPADVTYPPGMIAAGIALAAAGAGSGDERAVFRDIPASLAYRPRPGCRVAAPAVAPPQRTIRVDVQLVTPDNAKEFYFPDSVY